MTVDVSPTNKNNSHHVSLNDGITTYGLILSPNGNAIQRRPRANSQFVPFTQNDWSGGRGLKNAIEDRSRYADAKRINTRKPGLITLGGLETYTTGHRQQEQYMPSENGVTWKTLIGSDRYIATQVTASASGNRARVYLPVRRRGTPAGSLTAELCANTGTPGDPFTVLKSVTVSVFDIEDTISQSYEFTFTLVEAVTSTTKYWIKVYPTVAGTATDYWQVGVDAGAGSSNLTKASSDGIAWSSCTYDLYFRLVDDIDIAGVMFFPYRSQLYMLTRPTATSAPKMYVNGYRGIATGAGQSRTVLQDTTQSFQANALADALLLIIEGTNSEWSQPYKTILSNDGDEITTDAFGAAHVTGQTAYVILGTNIWTEVTGHGLTVLPTSIVATGDMVYFAQGDKTKMRRMREYVNNGVWTREFNQEDNYAKFLLDYQHPTKGLTICKANDFDNTGRPSFAQASAEAWGRRLKFPWLITDCEATTGWTAGAGAAITNDNADFMTGTKSIKIAVSSGPADPVAYFSTGSEFSRQTNVNNLAGQRQIRFWFKAGANQNPGNVKIYPSVSGTAVSTIQDLPLPALVAGEWQQITLPYIDTAAGLNVVLSLGIRVAATGNYWIDGIEVLPAGSEVPLGKPGDKVTGLERYGDPEVPWVFRAGSVGYIDNGVYIPVPIREYQQVENIHNGAGHLVHDVYLYWSFLQGIEEYYRANLDDVGPNKDEGLPADRQGYVTSMIGYPDRFLYNYDAGSSGYSSIMTRKGGGHHEDYRCDALGKRIRKIFLQVIPGDMADRLWFSEGEDVAYLPMPGNTVNELTDSTYRFTHEGVLETGWIGDDQQRIFSGVKLGSENLSTARCIEWDYKLNEETAWTAMSTPFTSGPVQTLALNKTGKRLKLRFRMQTNDPTETPRITSINVPTTMQPDTRYSYSMNIVYQDNGRDLLGNSENYMRAETLIAQLDTWSASKTPLTMRSISETFDNKTVILDPTPLQPDGSVANEQQEKQSGTLTASEPQ